MGIIKNEGLESDFYKELVERFTDEDAEHYYEYHESREELDCSAGPEDGCQCVMCNRQ
jgi:hypothetical protein